MSAGIFGSPRIRKQIFGLTKPQICGLPDSRYLEISYADFVNNPLTVITAVLLFLGLKIQPAVATFVTDTVKRKTDTLDGNPLSWNQKAIGGELLNLSLEDGKGVELTRRYKERTRFLRYNP